MKEVRHHPETVRALTDAGWTPGRDTGGRVHEWVEDIKSGPDGSEYPEVPAAVLAMLREFGGLHVQVTGPGASVRKEPFVLDPREHILRPVAYARISELVESVAYPLGVVYGSLSALIGDAAGRVYILTPGGEEILGKDIYEALDSLALGIASEPL